MEQWIIQIQTLLTSERSTLNARQRRQLEELNFFITSELVRINTTSSNLTTYNRSIEALTREVERRFDEIIREQTPIVAAVLATFFATVFVGHVGALLANSPMTLDVPSEANLKRDYKQEIDGSFYVESMYNSKKYFMSRLGRDLAVLRRMFVDGAVDISAIYKMRDDANRATTSHFDFMDDQELHRVKEAAKYESASYMWDNGISTEKTWDTRRDDRVRDNPSFADHVVMQDAKVKGHEYFHLVPFGLTHHPLGSGIPEQDINCRCQAIYEII